MREQSAWEELLSSASRLQKIIPDAVLSELESIAGWETARIRPPVLILGKLDGIDTGIRQLIRQEPLETETMQTQNGETITVPTMEEILRIKGMLILQRNTTRDYLDFSALADGLGDDKVCHAMRRFDELYPQKNGESALMQLQAQLAMPSPYDLDGIDLSTYRHLQPRWHNWESVQAACIRASQILATELERPLAEELKKGSIPGEERLRIVAELQSCYGSDVIVTDAQKGRAYNGKTVLMTEDYTAQEVSPNKIILHRNRVFNTVALGLSGERRR